MKQIASDPSLKNLKAFSWEDLEDSLQGPIEKFQAGAEVDFDSENRSLKRNGKRVAPFF